MKNYTEVVGIDVSKETLDATIHHSGEHAVFGNTVKGYRKLLEWCEDRLFRTKYFLCYENTGNYSLKLSLYLSRQGVVYVEESPLRIKRSTGLAREKTDRVDSALIARFGWVHREELSPSVIRPRSLRELGRLLALRDQLVKNRSGLISTLKEARHHLSSPSTDACCRLLGRSIAHLDKQVIKVEERMRELLSLDDLLNGNFRLLNSIKGVGLVLSCQLIYHTDNFNCFDDWRSFSSYCGIAPFEYSSGKSIMRRKQCHYLGDRKMKTLLSMAAVSAIRCDRELKAYYQRKLEEGKHKMIALNNVRNKILARAFSVIKRGTPYVEMNTFAA